MQAASRFSIFLFLFLGFTTIACSQQSKNDSFFSIHHDLGALYKDSKTNKYYGGCTFKLPKDCQFLYLFIQDWHFNEKEKEISIAGSLWNIYENHSSSDTLPVQQFEIFIGRPKNGKLYKTKTLVDTWTLKTIHHNNSFAIKTKVSKQDRLYINAKAPYYLQEWFIGSLLD